MVRDRLRAAMIMVGVLLAVQVASAQVNGDRRDHAAGDDARIDQWAALLIEASAPDVGWRRSFAAGQQVADLEPDVGLAVVQRAWPDIERVLAQQQIVKGWHFREGFPLNMRLHPHTFAFFAMVLEADPEGNGAAPWVVEYLPNYAWRTFASIEQARAWVDGVVGREPVTVAQEAMQRWASAWREGDAEARASLAAALVEVRYPFRGNPGLAQAAQQSGIVDVLAGVLHDTDVPAEARIGAFTHVRTLRPQMHDEQRWDAIERTIEDDIKQEQQERDAAEQARREAALADRIRTVDGDANKRWILHGPGVAEPTAEGFGMLVVLPGGDGSLGFTDFVANFIAAELGSDYLVVQMIAPPIEQGDEHAIVWPTERLPDDRVDFTIEPVIERAIADVRAEHAVDPERIFIMGWSSGGPTSYGMLVREGSPVRGAFVVMSVFKPQVLPPLDRARGKSVYILHSPEDFIAMDYPQTARDELGAAGARVRLETYDGGHGWQGDSLSHIKRAVEWLEHER